MRTSLLPIAKEGWNYIAYAIGFSIFFSLLDLELLSFFSFLVLMVSLYIFRNPERELVRFENQSVVSPVDGRISSIEELEDSEYAYKVIIESKYSDVAILRTPLTGSLISTKNINGTRLSLSDTLASKINENATLIFQNEEGNKIKISHYLDRSFCNLSINVSESQKLFQSARYGLMLSGETIIYLPQNFRLNVSVGNELTASESLIGYFS
ncbi:MAG: phosphatidylserine decarboxylase [Epsilonproteobacteria bacterium]|nr:MAG: phosphatidylserine decarboxylase [Campylobacterota bacterium]